MKKEFVKQLGFQPKENSSNIFTKKYSNSYILEVNFDKEFFNYGNKIKIESKTTSNFSQAENWVVFECVNRLLEKGYNPEDLILEKTYKLGHINKGRLDILVKNDGKTFLMIECKTWGKEFEKEFNNMKKDGGQLFSYFQQDREAEFLVLYASDISEDFKDDDYVNEIVSIEEHYKETTSVVDFYDRWNKLTKQNGVFEPWVNSYKFESRALTKKDLKPIKQEDASIIFNSFLEILRKNTVSDKPNAFNKIFTLFLCKIYDEGDKRNDEELSFQWVEGKDNHIDFQLKLTDLYKKGMQKLLKKEVTDLSNEEFNKKFGGLSEEVRIELLKEFNKIRLEKNNEFAIKDVFDKETFEENAIVLKEVVELLQKYKIRYEEKQPFLGDFFELLLTTGLKQEAGQFFTPVPIAKFICKSIPVKNIIEKKLEKGDSKDLLPTVIDYAAGSGHFLTESMEEIQTILKNIPKNNLRPDVEKKVKSWDGNFEWAYDYMYGIEKDYRLVKTAKVGCFLHGDGIANVIHGDGLDSFGKSKKYRGKLKIEGHNSKENKDNGNFDLVLSNPPYSVGSFRSNLKEYAKDDFELFSKLTEQSSEIEALFIERTSQLLKEGGIAGIILPSTILSNTGIYTKAREIILKDFAIIAITELGSNTFMATGTNTVTLFLRKRNKFFASNLKTSVNNFFENPKDITLNGIEKAISKYVSEVWEGLDFEDYKTLLEKNPSEKIKNHEIFKDYQNKIKSKNKIEEILDIEKEKLFYFVLAYSQKVVLVKSGEKKTEKEFLGYEFSARKGSEGIHPMQRGKQIDECTKLFDPKNSENPDKASTYIFDAFNNNFDRKISKKLKDHIFRTNLSDLLTFDRTDFEKTISLNLKKKIKIESKFEQIELGENIKFLQKSKRSAGSGLENGEFPFFTSSKIQSKFINESDYNEESLILGDGGNSGLHFSTNFSVSDHNFVFNSNNNKLLNRYIYLVLLLNFEIVTNGLSGSGLQNISKTYLKNIKIPLPPKDIQQKIVDEILELEKIEEKNLEEIEKYENEIKINLLNIKGDFKKLSELVDLKNGLNYDRKSEGEIIKIVGVKDFQEHFTPILSKLEQIQVKGNLLKDYELKNNDLLVVRSNGSKRLVGRFLYITNLSEKTSFSGFTIRLRLKSENNNAKFLCYFLKSEKIRNELFNKSDGSNIKSLNQVLLGNLKVPLPSLEKQKETVGGIEILEGKIDTLKQENKNIPEKKKEILEKYL